MSENTISNADTGTRLQPGSRSLPALRYRTSDNWTSTVLDNFDAFLQDHAAAEKKASGMALSMISHYPDRLELVESMAELAIEELAHFKEVIKLLHQRGLQLTADTKDPYVLAMRELIRRGPEHYLLDRLITSAVIEARGCERFQLVADALPEGSMQRFYQSIARSEGRHYSLLAELAYLYFPAAVVSARLDEVIDAEASIAAGLPIAALLH